MDERFSRYILPGLSGPVFIGLGCLLLNPIGTLSAMEEALLVEVGGDYVFRLGLSLVGGVVASGGLGYLLGSFYFAFYWSCFFPIKQQDHTSLFEDLRGPLEPGIGWLRRRKELRNRRRASWERACFLWHSMKENVAPIRGLEMFTSRLAHIAHGQGTLIASLFFALVTLTVFLYAGLLTGLEPVEILIRTTCASALWILSAVLLVGAYNRTLRSLEKISNDGLTATQELWQYSPDSLALVCSRFSRRARNTIGKPPGKGQGLPS